MPATSTRERSRHGLFASRLPKRIIILCPNHTGKGRPLAIVREGAWETPLGLAPIDSPLADCVKGKIPLLSEDAEAIAASTPSKSSCRFSSPPPIHLVPIVGTAQFDILEKLGEAVAETIRSQIRTKY